MNEQEVDTDIDIDDSDINKNTDKNTNTDKYDSYYSDDTIGHGCNMVYHCKFCWIMITTDTEYERRYLSNKNQ